MHYFLWQRESLIIWGSGVGYQSWVVVDEAYKRSPASLQVGGRGTECTEERGQRPLRQRGWKEMVTSQGILVAVWSKNCSCQYDFWPSDTISDTWVPILKKVLNCYLSQWEIYYCRCRKLVYSNVRVSCFLLKTSSYYFSCIN